MVAPSISGFALVDRIGAGGTGEVWRAEAERTGRTVALKVSHPSPRHGAGDLDFKMEYQLHHRLEHDHIVRAREFGEVDDQRRFYTMDFLTTVSLAEVYRLSGLTGLGRVALAVCEALEYAHSQGILHGDIKPENILVTEGDASEAGRVLLADFGHFRRLGDGPRSGVRGTLRYLPPEELSGQRLDARADLYSLGVTLREAILGQPLFDVDEPRDLFRALLDDRFTPIAGDAPEVGADWAELLDGLVARNREGRPDSAAVTGRRLRDLLGETPRGARASAIAPRIGPTLAHVGRESLVSSVLGRLKSDAGPRTILIEGEEGVGKTRLAEEIVRNLEIDGDTVHRSDVREREGHHFSALRHVHRDGERSDLLRDVTGLEDTTGRETEPAADPLVPSPELGPAGRERLVEELLRETDRRSKRRFFLFDSLDVADLDSLEVLETLARRLDPRTRLILVARRTAEASVLDRFRGQGTEAIRLEPMTDEELRPFVAALLGDPLPAGADEEIGGHEVLDTLVPWLRDATGGVPGRVESALRFAADEGRLAHDGRAWTIAAPLPDAPAASEDSLARFERQARSLSPTSRKLLEAAAVLGGEFERLALPPLDASGLDVVAVFLAEGLQSGLLLRSSGDAGRIRFAEPAGARRLAEQLPAKRRVELHSTIADRLARLGDDRDRSADLARHLELAGRGEAAARAYLERAESAHADRAFREASRFYRKAWDLRPDLERHGIPAWTPRWIRALSANEENEEVIRLVDEIVAARPGPEAHDEVTRELRILQSMALKKRGDRARAIAVLEDLLEPIEPYRSPALDAFARIQLGSYLSAEGRDEGARRHLTVARDVAVRAGLARTTAHAERHLGVHAWRRGDLGEALEWLDRAESHASESGDRNLLATIRSVQAICHWYRLDAHQAVHLHREAAAGFRHVHRVGDVARSQQNLAHVLVELGRWEEAEKALESAGRTIRVDGDRRLESYHHYARGNLAMYRGLFTEATEHAGRAVEIAEALEEPVVYVSHLGLLALIHEEAGRWEEARRVAERCLGIARDCDNGWGIANSLLLLARVARANGDGPRALGLLDEAAGVAERSDQPVASFRIELERAEARAEVGDDRGSRLAIGAAREMQARCDSVLWEAQVQLAHGRAVTALQGPPEAACQDLSGAYERFTSVGAEKLRTDTLVALATAHHRLGNESAARSAWAQARSRYLNLGLPVPAAPIPEPEGEEDDRLASNRRLLEATTTISRELTRIRPMDEVLRRILDVALTFLGAERGVVALVDPSSGELRVALARNLDQDSVTDKTHVSWSAIERVGRRGEVVHSGDALADPQLTGQESVNRERIRSLISLPIRSGQELLGAIYMDHRELPDLFGQAERSFLRFIADMAAVGLRNSRAVDLLAESERTLIRTLEEDDLDLPRGFVARDPGFRRVIREALAAIRAGRTVLLTGPTGSGKDRVAKALHEMGGFAGDFVDCFLPNIPDTLVDSELFGTERGVATDVTSRRGRVEEATQGLLFLNEIAELPLGLQSKLLHFLDDREYRRVGGSRLARHDGEILCATNADLERMVSEGRFRSDLFFRLAGCALRIPPLSERPDDIPELTDHFLRRIERNRGEGRITLHPDARDLLLRCSWKGNVRELEGCLETAVLRSPDGFLRAEHLDGPSLRILRETGAGSGRAVGNGGLDEMVGAFEIQHIEDALRRCAGIISQAARSLGLTEQALRRRIRKYRLEHRVKEYKRLDS